MEPQEAPGEIRPPYGAAALAAGSVLLLYIVTLAPSTAFWDASEYIATAHILGIPHPPGNPLFVMLGRVWSLLLTPLGLPVAVKINLLAAVTSAAASGCFYLIAHRALLGLFTEARFAKWGAAASAIVGATALTVWSQSNVNEKVYTVSVFVIALVSWLAVRWRDRHDEPGSERYLLAALFVMVLGTTNHMMSALPLPALLVLVAVTDIGVFFRPPVLARGLVLVLLGLSFNFVLPIRAELDPAINEGDPTCESFVSAAEAVFSNGRRGCPMLAANLTREQYQPVPITERQSPFGAQMKNYFQYFDWQWSRGADPSELPGTARVPFTLLFGGFGFLGLFALWKSDRKIFAYLLVLTATLTVGLVVYLNFKYGFSLYPEVADRALHEVRERDYFFIAGFLVWGALAGLGISWVWHTVAGITDGTRRYLVASPVLLVALIPLGFNWSWADRSGDYAARDWAYDLLMSVEPYGILFTNGDNDTFPLWYLQEVEGIRADVTVIVGQYLNTAWYPKQLQDLTSPERQRPFDPSPAPDLYAMVPAPTRAIVDLSHEVMDQVGAVRLDEDWTVSFPAVAVQYPAGMILDRSHRLALAIIHDAIQERPIFFASTGGMMAEIGLDRWGVRHGLAVKLEIRRLDGTEPEGWVQGTPPLGALWFDVDQSLRLYENVYSYRGIKDRPIWQDRSTLNIPWQYYALALQLADVAREGGRPTATIEMLEDDAFNFQLVAQGGTRGTPGS